MKFPFLSPRKPIDRLKALKDGQNDWVRFVPAADTVDAQDSKKLWVIFSHINIPAGKFAQSHIFEDVPGNKLFLNCPDNGWYQQGVPGLTSSAETMIDFLTSLSEHFEMTFVGHSMGAYMALICGNIVRGSRFISTSPEPILGVPFSRSHHAGFTGAETLGNLLNCDLPFHGAPNGVLLFGAYDPVDTYFLSEPDFSDRFGPIFEVAYHHGVTEYLTARRIYHKVLAEAPEHAEQFTSAEFFKPRFGFGSAEQYRHYYETFAAHQRGELSRAVEMIGNYADWRHAGWQEFRSKILEGAGESNAAFEAAEMAYQLQPDVFQFIETYGTACLNNGDYVRLYRVLDSMTFQQRRHRFGERLINAVEEKLGDFGRRKVELQMPQISVSAPNSNRPDDDFMRVDMAEVEELARAGRHLDVLIATAGISEEKAVMNAAFCRARGLALVLEGDAATGRRLLLSAVKNGRHNRRLAETILQAARTLQDTFLLQVYLEMDLKPEERARQSRAISKLLPLVSEPSQIVAILSELLRIHSDCSEDILDAIARLAPLGILETVLTGLLNQLSPEDILVENQSILRTVFMQGGREEVLQGWLEKGTDSCR